MQKMVTNYQFLIDENSLFLNIAGQYITARLNLKAMHSDSHKGQMKGKVY